MQAKNNKTELNYDYIEKNRKILARYPPELVEALLVTLVEFSPTETTWESIWAITARVNERLFPSGDKESKRVTGVKIGDLLRLLFFTERKRIRLSMHVLVRHDILRLYRKEIA